MEGDVVHGPVDCVSRGEVVQALKGMKTKKVPGPSDASLELMATSVEVAIQVMMMSYVSKC